MRSPLRGHYLLLLFLGIVGFLLFLDAALFNTRGEPREAIVALSMLQDGNWVLPVNNGDEIAFKPPFLHWLIALFSLPTGHVTEFTSRLPSALAAIVMSMTTYRFFAKRGSATVALLTATICLTCFEVHRAAMACRVDMLLSALMVGGMYALYTWQAGESRKYPLWALLCLACAGLTKGPVGVLLPCAAVALYFFFEQPSWRRLWGLAWRNMLVAVMALLPLAAWYVAAYLQPHGGERFLHLVYEENVLRLLGRMTYASHVNPWHYNVTSLLAGTLPYSLMIIAAVVLWTRKNVRDLRHPWQNFLAWYRSLIPCARFSLVVLTVVFVFFCIPASKRSVYLLPLYPFAAYFLASMLTLGKYYYRRSLRTIGYVISALSLLTVCLLLIIKMVGVEWLRDVSLLRPQEMAMAQAVSETGWGFVPICLLLICTGATLLFLRRRCLGRKGLVSVVFCLQLLLDGLVLPAALGTKSDFPVAREIERLAPTGSVYSFRSEWVEGDRMHPFTINFYLQNRVVPLDKVQPLPERGILVFSAHPDAAGRPAEEAFAERYPTLSLTLLHDPQHRSCDDHNFVRVYSFVNAAR